MFPHLFSPLAIGGVTLRNRVVSSGHDTVMAEHGLITDRLVAYHAARARGGAGLIVVQVAGVHETARYTSHVLMATGDDCIDGYRALAAAVKPHGTVLFGQLFHPGREVMDLADGTLTVAVAPRRCRTSGSTSCRGRCALPRSARSSTATARPPRGCSGPAWTASRSSPATATSRPVPQPGRSTCGPTSTAAPRRAGLRFLQGGARSRCRRQCGPGFVVGLRISMRRAGSRRTAHRHRVRRERVAGRRRARRLPQRHHRKSASLARLRPHRAAD